MRIRPRLRHVRSAVACALAVGLGGASNAWSQSLIEALSTTYNSNPDLLASRAILRQTDETLSQAVANWRPRVTLNVEFNRTQQDLLHKSPGRGPDVLRTERQVHDPPGRSADLSRRQDSRGNQAGSGQYPGTAGGPGRYRADDAPVGRDVLCRSRPEHRHRRCTSQQRPRAGPAARRDPRALPGRRTHDYRRIAVRGAPRGGAKPISSRRKPTSAFPRHRSSARSASGRASSAKSP